MPTNATIVFPPQFEPFQPYLAGAALQAALRRSGVHCTFQDLNLAYYREVFGPLSAQIERSDQGTDFELSEYKAAVQRMDSHLRATRIHGFGFGFYDTTFGKPLFSGEGLLEIVRSRWGEAFRGFLDSHFSGYNEWQSASLVAVTLVVHDQLPAAIVLSQFLREAAPDVHICWGGPLVSRIGKNIARERELTPFFDSLVLGAGEIMLPLLARAVSEADQRPQLAGVICSGHADCDRVGIAPPTHEFLVPDFSGFPLNDYLSPQRVLPYLTSRGCYWGKCEFCCHYLPFDKYQTASVAGIVDQIEYLSQKHDVRHFSFSDEAIPVAILKKLSQEIIERGLNIRWFTFARMEKAFDYDACRLLYRAGCRILMFGFESAVQRVQDAMQKGTRVEHVLPILKACHDAGISIRLDVLIGFPSETLEESEMTLEFLLRHRDIIDTPFSVTPLSKYELHGDAPMQRYLERFGVKSYEPLRGPLDYQRRYSVSAGMGPDVVESQYRRYVDVISKEFRAHARMPENKTHAFLMKSAYGDRGEENTVFSDELSAEEIQTCGYSGLEFTSVANEADGTWIVANHRNGAKVKVGATLATVISDLKSSGRFERQVSDSAEDARKIAKFLTYLQRHGFLRAYPLLPDEPTALLRV